MFANKSGLLFVINAANALTIPATLTFPHLRFLFSAFGLGLASYIELRDAKKEYRIITNEELELFKNDDASDGNVNSGIIFSNFYAGEDYQVEDLYDQNNAHFDLDALG